MKDPIVVALTGFDYHTLNNLLALEGSLSVVFEYDGFRGTIEDFLYYLPFWEEHRTEEAVHVREIFMAMIAYHKQRVCLERLSSLNFDTKDEDVIRLGVAHMELQRLLNA